MRKYFFGIYLTGLTLLIIGGCFNPEFLWLILGYGALFSVFLTPQELVLVIIFYRCFEGILYYPWYIHLYLVFLLVGHYVWAFIHGEQTANPRLLIPLLVWVVFLALPLHTTAGFSALSYALDLILIYVVYQFRHQINWVTVIKFLSFSIILSGVLGLLLPFSTYLQENLPEFKVDEFDVGYRRFEGLTYFPNQYAAFALFALGGLMLLQHRGKLSTAEFLVWFGLLYVFVYQAVARTFVLAFLALIGVFAGLTFVKYRWRAFNLLLPLALMLVVVSCVFIPATKAYFTRLQDEAMVNDGIYLNPIEMEDEAEFWEMVKNGQITYDTGRRGQWNFYFHDWLTSPATFLFGRGPARPYFGNYTANNFYLFYLWKNGVVGIFITLIMLAGVFDWRWVKTPVFWRRVGEVCLVLVPMALFAVFNCNDDWDVLVVIFALLYLAQSQPGYRLPKRLTAVNNRGYAVTGNQDAK